MAVHESEGSLIYRTDKGQARLKNWKGRLEGESSSGSLQASLIAPSFCESFFLCGRSALKGFQIQALSEGMGQKRQSVCPFAPEKKLLRGRLVLWRAGWLGAARRRGKSH